MKNFQKIEKNQKSNKWNFFLKCFFKKLIVNFFFKFKFKKKMKNFQKNVNLKKMMKMFKKIKKSEKPSKNQRKIFLQKNFRIFYFSQNYCRILFLPKTFINGPKKWKFWNNWFFSARGPRKLWQLHFQNFTEFWLQLN